ncbi:MAG TPA: DUF1800 domain-containing protein [Gaiellaceae bacterium]|nr:DUF1800 domain-containing protein [Gaiellaceae bacterium]
MPRVALYEGSFTPAHAERLLWRAGFGPRPGEAEALAKLGLAGAVEALTHPKAERLVGPRPHDDKGRPLAPAAAWGHDHAWWLDRMVRTSRPLVERLALVWHDWFATSNDGVGSQRLMLRQNQLFREHGLGSFPSLLERVTADPAMLLWLNGSDNSRWSPNENYAREMMELFTLGAGRGYGERDVRQQARALTGFRNDWHQSTGPVNFRYDPRYHDPERKTIFGKHGRFAWKDSVRLCVAHHDHASFFVRKLWGYFVPRPPDGATQAALERLYVRGGHQIRPVVAAILRHPALHEGPRLTKPPVVYTAGLLRRLGRGIDTTAWVWLDAMAGQQLFRPPNVAGWDDTRWLDTATWRGRWWVAQYVLRPYALDPGKASQPFDAEQLVAGALDFWRSPELGDATRAALLAFARNALADAAGASWKRKQYAVMTQNALRHLIAVSPELQAA